ncbi:hypothetical protein HKD37_01G001002 [Glycine soja]
MKRYDINNFSFYTKSHDDKSRVQNSGVSLDVDSLHFSSASNNNLIRAFMPYFQELGYSKFTVPIVKYKSINGNIGVRHDKMRFTLVDLDKVAYKDKPFITIEQAIQIRVTQDGLWIYREEQVVAMVTTKLPSSIINSFRLYLDKPKVVFHVNPATGRASSPHKKKFHSYLGIVARDKINILYSNWKDVLEALKNLIWDDIVGTFDIPEVFNTKKKFISSVATLWRNFMSSMTTNYVYIDKEGQDDQTLCNKYGQDPKTCEEFKKAQDIQKHNNCPHLLSSGGYLLLEKNMMEDKRKKRQEESFSFLHMTHGCFVPHGHQDILTIAIGRPEHSSHVCAMGVSMTISQYFGHASHGSNNSTSIIPQYGREKQEENKHSIERIKEELREPPPVEANIQVYGAHVSTNGSCANTTIKPSGEEPYSDIKLTMWFIREGVNYTPCALTDDMVKVLIEEVRDADAQVLFPTLEVQCVGQVHSTFIAWLRHLVKPVSHEDSHRRPKKHVESIRESNPIGDPLAYMIKNLLDLYMKPF